MAWTFIQATGEMIDPSGEVLATGYAGYGAGKNNPAMQDVHGVQGVWGPLPCGMYAMELITDDKGNACDYGDKKAPVIRLIPDPQNEMFNRNGFLLHGDNVTHTASDGCIIQGHSTRVTINASPDKKLQVIANLSSNAEDVENAATGEN